MIKKYSHEESVQKLFENMAGNEEDRKYLKRQIDFIDEYKKLGLIDEKTIDELAQTFLKMAVMHIYERKFNQIMSNLDFDKTINRIIDSALGEGT